MSCSVGELKVISQEFSLSIFLISMSLAGASKESMAFVTFCRKLSESPVSPKERTRTLAVKCCSYRDAPFFLLQHHREYRK